MKNRKTMLIASALFLAMMMSACSGAGKAPEVSTVSVDTSSASTVSHEESVVSEDDADKPVVPRITYSKEGSGSSGYTKDDMTYEAAYAEEAADYAYSAKSVTADGITNGAVTPAAPADTAPASAAAKPGSGAPDGEIDDPIVIDPGTSGDIIIDPEIIEIDPPIQPEAGLLTAGEWKDNDNWGFFTNLVNTQKIIFPSFGIDPRFRVKVEVTTPENQPIVNASVDLLDKDGNKLWSAVTNKSGTAYLFEDENGSGASLRISDGTKTQEYPLELDLPEPVTASDQQDQQGQQQEKRSQDAVIGEIFDGESRLYKKLDLMFIVDATGSMSDEMTFLQTEFTAISEAVGGEDTRYSVNFYRDEGDAYVTKCYDFTKNVKDLQTNLNSEYAVGGGDMPEAVDRILEESILKSSWSEDSVKLAFMIFDAPPHEGTEESILKSIKAASEKGIRLIPVISSNSERETELFGRACAITTGGTYVFLTDDSGIGYSHLEPIIGKYEVEKLYDLIIRVIGEYKQ